MKNLINFLFEITPKTEFSFYTEILILAGSLILISIIFSLIYNKVKKHNIAFKRTFKNVSKLANTFGIIFLILTGLRYEGIPFFSMRIWMYTTALFFAYIILKYIQITIIKYPKIKKEIEHRRIKSKNKKNKKKYLPNK